MCRGLLLVCFACSRLQVFFSLHVLDLLFKSRIFSNNEKTIAELVGRGERLKFQGVNLLVLSIAAADPMTWTRIQSKHVA